MFQTTNQIEFPCVFKQPYCEYCQLRSNEPWSIKKKGVTLIPKYWRWRHLLLEWPPMKQTRGLLIRGWHYLEISWNGGTPKWRVYAGTSNEKGWFRGTPILGNLHFRSCHGNSTFDPHVCSSAPISIIVTACCGHAIFGPGKFIAQPAAKWIKYCFFVNAVNG